jgi:hypothetical protein
MSDDLLNNYKANYFVNFDTFFANNELFLSILFNTYKYKLQSKVMDNIHQEWKGRQSNIFSFRDLISIQQMPPGALPIYDKDPDVADIATT